MEVPIENEEGEGSRKKNREEKDEKNGREEKGLIDGETTHYHGGSESSSASSVSASSSLLSTERQQREQQREQRRQCEGEEDVEMGNGMNGMNGRHNRDIGNKLEKPKEGRRRKTRTRMKKRGREQDAEAQDQGHDQGHDQDQDQDQDRQCEAGYEKDEICKGNDKKHGGKTKTLNHLLVRAKIFCVRLTESAATLPSSCKRVRRSATNMANSTCQNTQAISPHKLLTKTKINSKSCCASNFGVFISPLTIPKRYLLFGLIVLASFLPIMQYAANSELPFPEAYRQAGGFLGGTGGRMQKMRAMLKEKNQELARIKHALDEESGPYVSKERYLALKNRASMLSHQLLELTERTASLESQADANQRNMRASHKDQKLDVARLNATYAKVFGEMHRQINLYKQEIARYADSSEHLENQLNQATNTIATLKRELTNLQANRSPKSPMNATQEAELRKERQKTDALKTQLAQAEQQVNNLQEQLESVKKPEPNPPDYKGSEDQQDESATLQQLQSSRADVYKGQSRDQNPDRDPDRNRNQMDAEEGPKLSDEEFETELQQILRRVNERQALPSSSSLTFPYGGAQTAERDRQPGVTGSNDYGGRNIPFNRAWQGYVPEKDASVDMEADEYQEVLAQQQLQQMDCKSHDFEFDMDRPGTDYATFPVTSAQMCKRKCVEDLNCSSWVFEKRGSQCYLKNSAPEPFPSRCCVSGMICPPR